MPTDRELSKVKAVLTQGRKDLWNTQPPGMIGILYDPLREFLFDPAFAVALVLLPAVAAAIPMGDVVFATVISALFLSPMRPVTAEPQDINLRRAAKNDLLCNAKAGIQLPRIRPPSDIVSGVRGAFAFGFSVLADLVGALMDRQKMKKWFQALTEFKAYLDISGVGEELGEAMMKPLLRGRLLDNVKILNDIQEQLYVDRHETIKSRSTTQDVQRKLDEAHRMMRFATAAYGTEMIRSALDRHARPQELETQMQAIAFHSDVPTDDIRILYVDDGGSMKVLRHFVAIDRKSKSVVLALRGTLSISGALVDMQAMDADFCGGKAHKGMAEMADNIWAQSGSKIVQLFQEERELDDFAFVILGHSLGAGTACLLNVKCHKEKLLGNRVVKCFGFAPPPTFYFDESSSDHDGKSAIERAIANSVCYIHDNDCVPFLSVLAIRRLALLMDAVDNQTEHMWAPRRFKIFWEWEDIPQDIFDAVRNAELTFRDAVNCANGASPLKIPAHVVVWMKKKPFGGFDAVGCDPAQLVGMNVFCCEDMVTDHLPEQYEDALDALASTNGNIS